MLAAKCGTHAEDRADNHGGRREQRSSAQRLQYNLCVSEKLLEPPLDKKRFDSSNFHGRVESVNLQSV